MQYRPPPPTPEVPTMEFFEFHQAMRKIEEERRMGLMGRNVHGVTDKKPSYYYYTPSEWSRSIGWGTVPDERNTELRGVKQDRRTDEDVSEESDTKYKSQ